MIRRPTILPDLYAWHRQALAGFKPQVTHEPQCGWFKRRLVQGGPMVPARIWMHQEIDEDGELTAPEELRCEVGGKRCDPVDAWTWICADPITEAEFNYMVADAAYCREHHPSSPEANPTARAASRSIPPLF